MGSRWGRRGRFGGPGRGAKPEKFVLFPEVQLPDIRNASKEEEILVTYSSRLQNYWRKSPYYLEEISSNMVGESRDIERYTDREKPKLKHTRDSFMQFLEANTSNFPKELIADSREDRRKQRKKVQWNPDSDLQKLDLFEKLEQKYQSQEEKGEKEKKEGEEEEQDDDEVGEEADEELSDDGDYNQNVDFDDDEDDFNMGDDNDGEAEY